MTYSLLDGRRAWLAAAVAGSAAVAAYALLPKLNILVAIAAAVAVGLVMERANAMSTWEAALTMLGSRC